VRDLAVDILAVVGRHDPVALAPHDQRWELLDDLDPVERAHPLPVVVDDRAERVDERSPRRAVCEQRIGAPELLEVGAPVDPEASLRAGTMLRGLYNRPGRREGQHGA
jgi:hypothetical protein